MASSAKTDNAKRQPESLGATQVEPSNSESAHAAAALSEERIRERAYLIWIEEGQPDGRAEQHWLRARQEMEQDAR